MSDKQSQVQVQVRVKFYSFFKELTGCPGCSQPVAPGSTLANLIQSLAERFPKLGPMHKSMLTAVGVEYQDRSYVLRDGDEVSLFPPVQGG
jgi:molybdopterin converting factor small subunit